WQKLEEENADFFRAYYIRLKLKKQIILFNHLLEHQYHLMKYPVASKVPLAPIQNGIHPMQVNNLPMGYPVLQPPPITATGQPHLDSMGCGISSCHVVNGVPAPGNFHPIRMHSGNDMVMDSSAADVPPAIPPSSAMSDMAVSPPSMASTGHFPFTASEISGIGVDTSALDTAFTSDVASSVGLQLPPDSGAGNSRDSLRSLAQIPWNFSLSDLTSDLSNLGDLGALGNYPGSPFLPSDSDLLLDSPEQEDIVEEFFVDSAPGPPGSQSDEESVSSSVYYVSSSVYLLCFHICDLPHEGDTEEDENGGEGGEEAASEQGTVSSHPLARNERNIEDEDGKNGSEEGESGDGDDEGSDVSDTVNKGKPEREISPANGAKVAIDAISRNLALEWGTDYDIRVNGIAPGPIGDTTGTSKLVPEEIQSLAKDFMPKELGISFIFAGYSFSAIYHPSNIMLCIFF
ncbi:hypothetical protein U1Q18_046490, partial [Sarracenia purpurea var. burkii]